MYRLLGFATQNTFKTLYVLEALGVDYEFVFVNLMKGEQKSEAFQKLTPIGKTPVLQHNDHALFESGAICRYVANVEGSDLYPTDPFKRAQVDQWLDYFTCHLGRWLNELSFEHVIKERVGMGKADPKVCEQAEKFCHQQFALVDTWLSKQPYFTGSQMSIADLAAFAYIEQVHLFSFDISAYANVKKWYANMESNKAIISARGKMKAWEQSATK